MDSKTVIKLIEAAGWVYSHTTGDHAVFVRQGARMPTVVQHPRKDIPVRTLRSIERQSGVPLLKRPHKKKGK